MYPAPAAFRPLHSPFWRRIWVFLIGSSGALVYLISQAVLRARRSGPDDLIMMEIVLSIGLTMATWTAALVYSTRWGGVRAGCLRPLVVLLSPILVLTARLG